MRYRFKGSAAVAPGGGTEILLSLSVDTFAVAWVISVPVIVAVLTVFDCSKGHKKFEKY